jgi:hypothetical protein
MRFIKHLHPHTHTRMAQKGVGMAQISLGRSLVSARKEEKKEGGKGTRHTASPAHEGKKASLNRISPSDENERVREKREENLAIGKMASNENN